MAKKLILVRHGESVWNYQNKFTGWADINLTKYGEKQAIETGGILLKNNIIPKVTFTSTLRRSINTNDLILKQFNNSDIKTIKSWRLNEKHYGKLTGYIRNKDIKWKGEYFDIPPIISSLKDIDYNINKYYNPIFGESYYMTWLRLFPIWKLIYLDILNNNIPMVCAHKNSLKVIITYLENRDVSKINNIDIPNAQPIIYEFDKNMNIIKKIII